MDENVSPGEREEIWEILGVTLVEESLDLQNEVGGIGLEKKVDQHKYA